MWIGSLSVIIWMVETPGLEGAGDSVKLFLSSDVLHGVSAKIG
jgi:hypothetical protein